MTKIFVKTREVYDLHTEPNKLGFIAIHTPSPRILENWTGLATNTKMMRLVKCDVKCACASQLPADPQQIGTESGDIAPQDMFNPILYTATSNEYMNTILSGMYRQTPTTGFNFGDTNGPSASYKVGWMDNINQENLYYGLLAQTGVWKKSMPQSGFRILGLKPQVHMLVNTQGQLSPPGVTPDVYSEITGSAVAGGTGNQMRGPTRPLPAIPTMYLTGTEWQNPVPSGGLGSEGQRIFDSAWRMNYWAPVYVAAIILPPARLQQMYFRMTVEWTVEFMGLRGRFDMLNPTTLAYVGQPNNLAYYSDYSTQSKIMTAKASSLDTINVDAVQIPA